jgi:hypothetical protein
MTPEAESDNSPDGDEEQELGYLFMTVDDEGHSEFVDPLTTSTVKELTTAVMELITTVSHLTRAILIVGKVYAETLERQREDQ